METSEKDETGGRVHGWPDPVSLFRENRLILLAAALAASAVAGWLTYSISLKNRLAEARVMLIGANSITVSSIRTARWGHLLDGQRISNHPLIPGLLSRIEREKSREALNELQRLLRNYVLDPSYDEMTITDLSGRHIACSESRHPTFDNILKDDIAKAMRRRRPVIAIAPGGWQTAYMIARLPAVDGRERYAAVFSMNLETTLLRHLRLMPLYFRTGETVLSRLDEGQMILLASIRAGQSGRQMNIQRPRANSDGLPSLVALQGLKGATEGIDYRGERVIAAMSLIAESGWGIVTKVERSEIARPAMRAAMVTAASVLALLLAAGWLLQRGAYRRERTTLQRELAERKRHDRERDRLLAEIRRKNLELEEMFYVTSHDLRAPLINLLGFSETIRERAEEFLQRPAAGDGGKARREALQALDYIRDSGRRMDAILNGLTRVARLSRKAGKPENVDMNALLAELARAFAHQLDGAGEIKVAGRLPPCLADREAVARIFSNLIDNAIKYREPGRRLEIRASGVIKGGACEYSLADNGAGVPEAEREKIWQIFYRGSGAARAAGEGLGLVIVRRLAEGQGGAVRAESEHGKGSVFTVLLPRA